jgi:hypothetical protein
LLLVTLSLSGLFMMAGERNETPDSIPAVIPIEVAPVLLPGGAQEFQISQFTVDPEEIVLGDRGVWNSITFQLMEIEPGQAFPLYVCPECPVLALIVMQGGSLRFTLDGPVLLSQPMDIGVQQASPSGEVVLTGSDAALFDIRDLSGDQLFQNNGYGAARFLLAFLYTVDTPFHAGADEYSLIWSGAWNVEPFTTGDIGFDVDRIVLPPGATLAYEASPDRVDLFLLASGELEAQSADDEPFPSSLAHSWTAPAGVQTATFPPGHYSFVNSGPDDAQVFRLSLTRLPASATATPTATCADSTRSGC